jgi:hypothetical protein
LDFAD